MRVQRNSQQVWVKMLKLECKQIWHDGLKHDSIKISS